MKLLSPDTRLSVAPMMDWTDRHCRAFHRILAPDAWLYTEMVTSGAMLHGDDGNPARFLDFDPMEQPVVLQLGGSDPAEMAAAAALGARWGYREINLNCGCPSDRVQRGRFGACLMAEPALVADCIAAMRAAAGIPITVKCRIGIDDSEDYAFLASFARQAVAAGASRLIVHARKAWLQGLSPKQNREVPPLRPELVAELKASMPQTPIELNGGIVTLDGIAAALSRFDGAMLGRAAYQTPWLLAEAQADLLGGGGPLDRFAALAAFRPYIAGQLDAGTPLRAMTRHMLGLFQGLPGARRWRRILSEEARLPNAGLALLDKATEAVAGPMRRAA